MREEWGPNNKPRRRQQWRTTAAGRGSGAVDQQGERRGDMVEGKKREGGMRRGSGWRLLREQGGGRSGKEGG